MPALDTSISSSPEGAAAANRASKRMRAALRTRGRYIEGPDVAHEADVIDMDEAHFRRKAEVVDGGTAALEPRPAQTDAEGKVVDARAYRMAEEARQMIAEARAAMPDNGLDEDLLKKAGNG